MLFQTKAMLLSATSRKGQQDPDLHSVQNPEHALVSNKQEGLARSWLTFCSKPRACSCQQQAGRVSQILTYNLFKTQTMLLSATGRVNQILTYTLFKPQSMLLSATSRKGQQDPDLQTVQNPEHALVSNKQEGPARSWLTTSCSKPRACSCQQQEGRASQILTYNLFKTQSMLLSATSRKGQPDPDLHPVQTPEDALVSNKKEGPARSWLTNCSKPTACFCQQQAGWATQILTYILFKPQRMLLSATSRKGQQDPDLQTVQNPEHALVSNKQEGPARSWLTSCSNRRACSCQQQAGRASQILTYNLFKTQSMLLSATSRMGQPDPDLHPVQNPKHVLVSNKQEGPARSWLTNCSKSRPEHALVSNKWQEGPARSWLTNCSKPTACFCQQQAGWATQILTYILFITKAHSC